MKVKPLIFKWLAETPGSGGAAHAEGEAKTLPLKKPPEQQPEFSPQHVLAPDQPVETVFFLEILAVAQPPHSQLRFDVLLLDRSKMMDECFAGHPNAKTGLPGAAEKILVFVTGQTKLGVERPDGLKHATVHHEGDPVGKAKSAHLRHLAQEFRREFQKLIVEFALAFGRADNVAMLAFGEFDQAL